MHFHYGLFADILNDLASTVASMPPDDANHRDALRAAAKALDRALQPKARARENEPKSKPKKDSKESKGDPSALTPGGGGSVTPCHGMTGTNQWTACSK
jgi:hypothetical protein